MENKKILLVEEEPLTLDILGRFLRLWNYQALICSDSREALELIRNFHPDLILLDVSLPKLDGFKICEALKRDLFIAHIPIIILVEKRQLRKKILEIERGIDDYILKPPDPIDLQIRIEMALRRTEYQFHANTLTKLPGSIAIEKELQDRIAQNRIFSVCHYDIDNFKSFNDKYGYFRGDAVIGQTAHIISKIVRRVGNQDDFVGHIGGDDFVVITTPSKEEDIPKESILEFDRLIPYHYCKEDKSKGYITIKDRRGKTQNFPLMSISIAVTNNRFSCLETCAQIAQVLAEIKNYLKTLKGSNYLINRRTDRGKACGRMKVETTPGTYQNVRFRSKRAIPLGQRLLEEGLIDQLQLDEALRKHWQTGVPLGQVLVNMKLVPASRIGEILERQLKIPYIKLDDLKVDPDLANLIPEELIQGLRLLPLKKERNIISLAMVNPLDLKVIKKIKDITGCRVRPLLATEEELKEAMKRPPLEHT